MGMKIQPNGPGGVFDAGAVKTGENPAQKTGQKESPEGDRVELSKKSEDFSESGRIKAAAADEAEKGAGAEKLRRIKAAIENGTYFVSGDELAKALLGDSE